MIGIVIVAHGHLAQAYRETVEHVIGKDCGIKSIAIEAEGDRAAKQDEICKVADSVDQGDGVIIVTDLYGGSPSNLSLRACTKSKRRILYGANIPALIKLAKSRHLDVSDAVHQAIEAGKRYINTQNFGAE